MQEIFHHCLKLHAYNIQKVLAIKPDDRLHQKKCALDMLRWIPNDNSALASFLVKSQPFTSLVS
jgi:hypothetical protein